MAYKLVTNTDEIIEYCRDKKTLGIDTETNGLDFTTNIMTMFQIGDEENQFIIDTRVTSIEPLKELLESNDIVKIFHNAKFDYKFIRHTANIKCNNIYDTMLTEKVIYCGTKLGFSLGNLCQRYLNLELDKSTRLSFINMADTKFTDEQIKYGAEDVKHLCKIKDLQQNRIAQFELENTVALENDAVLALADIEYNGLDVDESKWLGLEEINSRKAIELAKELDELILTDITLSKFVNKYVQADLFIPTDEIRTVDVKWTSPKQVLELFQTFVPKLDNVNGKELIKYGSKFPIIYKYIKYKEAMKLWTSYGESFFKNFSGDGKIHTNFHQILDTGRISSSKPNMQQIPANNSFRNCFIAPDKWSFVSADYSSQELNVIAFGSKDPVWIKALEDGQDLHSTCAELVYGNQWITSAEDDCLYMSNKEKCNCAAHKKLRTNVKTINFGLAYGMGPNKLADTLNINISDAKLLIEKYFKAFPAIKGFLEKLGNYGKRYGYIKTFPPYNRKRWFTNWYPKIWDNKSSTMELGSIERASKNTPIQGASADMTKRALILMREHIDVNDAPVKLVMTVHDQIDTICQDDYVEEWSKDMKHLMEVAAKEIVTNGLLEAEVTVNNCWTK